MNLVASEVAEKWRRVGIQLNLNVGDLDCIETTHTQPIDRMASVFDLWKKRETKCPVTWNTVLQVLKSPSIGEQKLASKIKSMLV